MLRILLGKGSADPQPGMIHAIRNNHTEAIQLLLVHGAQIHGEHREALKEASKEIQSIVESFTNEKNK